MKNENKTTEISRYNVIVKGLSAKPLTNGGAMLRILFVWGFSGIWTIFPLFGWNRYVPEGNMTACGTDYITKDWVSRSYILAYSVACYYSPLFLIIYSYWFIVQVCDQCEFDIIRHGTFSTASNSECFDRLSLPTKKICENKQRK